MFSDFARSNRRKFLVGAAASAAVTLPSMASARYSHGRNLALQDDVGVTQFMNWDTMQGTPTEEVILAYQDATGNEVEIQPAPGTGTDYETRMRTMLSGGTAPDIMRVNDDFVRFYSSVGQALDLTPYIENSSLNPDDFYEDVWSFPLQPDGSYAAVPLGNQPRVIYYNVDMFEEAGIPLPPRDWSSEGWTWDDFLEIAQELTIEGERWGALVYDDTGCEQTFAINNGVDDGIYSADGTRFTLAEPEGIEAMQWLADLTLEHGVQPERGLLTADNAGNNLFLQGRVGMIFRTQGTMDYFRRNDIDFTFDVASPPAKVNHITEGSLICYMVPSSAQNPDGAWSLLEYMMGPEGSQIFAEHEEFIPAYRESAESVETEEGESPSNVALFSTAMDHHRSVNFTEVTENARNVYRPQLDLVWTGEATAEEVLTGVKEEVEAILNENA